MSRTARREVPQALVDALARNWLDRPPRTAPALFDEAVTRMTEAELQREVEALTRQLGLLKYHTKYSLGSDPGFPDLVIGSPRWHSVLFVELKRHGHDPRPNQTEWLNATQGEVWRPADFHDGRIHQALAALALGGAA